MICEKLRIAFIDILSKTYNEARMMQNQRLQVMALDAYWPRTRIKRKMKTWIETRIDVREERADDGVDHALWACIFAIFKSPLLRARYHVCNGFLLPHSSTHRSSFSLGFILGHRQDRRASAKDTQIKGWVVHILFSLWSTRLSLLFALLFGYPRRHIYRIIQRRFRLPPGVSCWLPACLYIPIMYLWS